MSVLSESLDVLFKNQLKGRGCSLKICLEAYQAHGFSPVVYLSLSCHSAFLCIESFLGFLGGSRGATPGLSCGAPESLLQCPRSSLLYEDLIP